MKNKTSSGKRASSRKPSLADQVDQYEIYQRAVQSPEVDVELIQAIYQSSRKNPAYHLREDFCGTGVTLSQWIQQGKEFTGEGFDIDSEPVEWGREHNFDALGYDGQRGTLHVADARDVSDTKPDVRVAFNFSYWVFQERAQMKNYFQLALIDLKKGGMMIVDATGGTEALSEEPFESDMGDFRLVWQQKNFSPVDHTANLSLRFCFEDGSELPPYRYRWRVWSIVEITEIMTEVGFKNVRVWWQDDDVPNIGYRITKKGVNQPCWIACISGTR